MTAYSLKIELLSDATFGRGDGVAGLVDVEVQHDEVGLPYLGGRTLKGLLAAECDDILFTLKSAPADKKERWQRAAKRLFGTSGAALEGHACLHVGPARMPEDLRQSLALDIEQDTLTRSDVLESLTDIRRQTAMDESGAPRKETLRSMRAIIRGLTFESPLILNAPSDDDLGLLAATAKALRRLGTGRNRGRGRVRTTLWDEDGIEITGRHLEHFAREVS